MNDNETIKKTVSLGKVDGYGNGRRSCEVTIDIAMHNGRLSICGNFWNTQHTDTIQGGQCYDALLELLPGNDKVREIVKVWKRWHLNDMRPECEHQRELGWLEQASDPLYAWELILDREAYKERKRIEETVLQQVRSTRQASISEEDAEILALSTASKIYTQGENIPPIPNHYTLEQPSYRGNPTNLTRGWVRENENPLGILCKPCPVCSYRYGSEWKFEAVPDSVIEQIKAW